jgi:hypothetical protein
MGPFSIPPIKFILGGGGGRDSFKPRHGWETYPHKIQKISIRLYLNMNKTKTPLVETDLSKALDCLNDQFRLTHMKF